MLLGQNSLRRLATRTQTPQPTDGNLEQEYRAKQPGSPHARFRPARVSVRVVRQTTVVDTTASAVRNRPGCESNGNCFDSLRAPATLSGPTGPCHWAFYSEARLCDSLSKRVE